MPSTDTTTASSTAGQPVTIFFDVNETLTDLSTVGDAFGDIGAEPSLSATWFAAVLRDGFALTSTSTGASFSEIAEQNARVLLHGLELNRDLDDAVTAVIDAFSDVHLHPDVANGLRALHDAGHRVFTLSNGSTANIERLLRERDLLGAVDDILTVDGHSPWKPASAAYLDAIARTHTTGTAYLAAVHPWDIHGAGTAGLSTAWINRDGTPYPAHFAEPTLAITTISELAHRLA